MGHVIWNCRFLNSYKSNQAQALYGRPGIVSRVCLTAFFAARMCASSASTGSTLICGQWPRSSAACTERKSVWSACTCVRMRVRFHIHNGPYWQKMAVTLTFQKPWTAASTCSFLRAKNALHAQWERIPVLVILHLPEHLP